MIDIDIKLRHIQLTADEVNLATGANARNALLPEFLQRLAMKPTYTGYGAISVHESVVKAMVTKYSEQVVYQPLNEIRHWFAYSSGAFIEPGYPPLFYSRGKGKKVSPNKSAVAGIGEGVAGFIAQRLYRCRKLARPNHDYPDIVMVGSGKTILVEAKSTISQGGSNLKATLEQEITRIVTYLNACSGLDKRPVEGLLIGTEIVSEDKYNVYLNEVKI